MGAHPTRGDPGECGEGGRDQTAAEEGPFNGTRPQTAGAAEGAAEGAESSGGASPRSRRRSKGRSKGQMGALSPEAAAKVQQHVEQSLPAFLDVMWRISVMDIEKTVAESCRKVSTANTAVPKLYPRVSDASLHFPGVAGHRRGDRDHPTPCRGPQGDRCLLLGGGAAPGGGGSACVWWELIAGWQAKKTSGEDTTEPSARETMEDALRRSVMRKMEESDDDTFMA